MATTQEELDLAFTEVGTEFKNVRALIGALGSLTTADKTTLISAINEINSKISSAGATINDTTATSSTVYSATKTALEIEARAASLKSEILGSAGPTVDTLKEIADLLTQTDIDNDSVVAALTTAVANRLRYDAPQALTLEQQAQANTNLGSVSKAQFGDPAHSYQTVFLNALA